MTARDWDRTSMGITPHGPQPCASANSATRASLSDTDQPIAMGAVLRPEGISAISFAAVSAFTVRSPPDCVNLPPHPPDSRPVRRHLPAATPLPLPLLATAVSPCHPLTASPCQPLSFPPTVQHAFADPQNNRPAPFSSPEFRCQFVTNDFASTYESRPRLPTSIYSYTADSAIPVQCTLSAAPV